MSYLTDFGDKLLSLLRDVPEEKRGEIVSFAQNAVYQSYKNGAEKGKEAPTTPAAQNERSTTRRGRATRR